MMATEMKTTNPICPNTESRTYYTGMRGKREEKEPRKLKMCLCFR